MKKDFDYYIYLFFLVYALILQEELEEDVDQEDIFSIQPLEKLAMDKHHHEHKQIYIYS
jgi:hypothetical protein